MRLLIVLLLAAFSTDSFKILVYNSKFGHSHSTFLGQIADILSDAGHNVTSLLPIINPAIKDGTEKSHKIHVQPDPVLKEFYENQKQPNFFEFGMFNPAVYFVVGSMFATDFSRTCKKVIEEPGLIERLRAEKYDVYISENFDVCGIGLAHAIAPKAVIASSSLFLYGSHFDEFGVEPASNYRPSCVTLNVDVHSLASRFWNAYAEFTVKLTFSYVRRQVNRVLREHFGEDYPSIAQQSSHAAYVLTNSEPLIESAAPTIAKVINVPDIGAKIAKPLDEYWESVLNRRKRAVLLSFGSFAFSTQLPEKSKQGILKAITNFPDVTFIWKYEDLEDAFAREAKHVDNLILTKWMPQVDILNHKNLAVFITHGGIGSTRETALRGVPGLFIPIFFDQFRNAGMAEFNGLGKVYDHFELHDDEKLTETLRDVLENKKYRENAHHLSRMLAKKPLSSKELLIRHVEFAAEFGPSAALRPQSVDMSFVDYHNLDVIGFLITISSVFVIISIKFVAWVLFKVFEKKTKAE